jgi:multicomponent K+:H+ antiporter subunit E
MSGRLPLLWLALVAMWLLMNSSLSVGEVILGALVALAGMLGLARLQFPPVRLHRPHVAAVLFGVVLLDIVRSNIAVAAIVLRPGTRGRTAGFLDIPLETRHPMVLAGLACIITATPGTAWARYDSVANVVTIHVLDLVDGATLARAIKDRYQSRLMEVFG